MPNRKTSALHEHRFSAPAARYFVTFCTHERKAGLTAAPLANGILPCIKDSDAFLDTDTIACCVMPDHVHWLFALGHRLTLGRVIARLKAQSGRMLAAADLKWQRDFFEHRLRAEEVAEDYARYVFLNPYRASLLPAGEVWPAWWSSRPEALAFTAHLNPNGSPPREWIGEAIPRSLVSRE